MGTKLALERRFGWPDDAKVALERRFGLPCSAKLALERRFRLTYVVKLDLERRLGGPLEQNKSRSSPKTRSIHRNFVSFRMIRLWISGGWGSSACFFDLGRSFSLFWCSLSVLVRPTSVLRSNLAHPTSILLARTLPGTLWTSFLEAETG